MLEKRKIFVSGSMEKKELHEKVVVALDKIMSNNDQIIIGDARGIDQKIQKYLAKRNYNNVLVCSITKPPRVVESMEFDVVKVDYDDEIKSDRDRQMKKDKYMTENSDISFIIWNGKSKGSYNNIVRAIKHNKEVQVFLDDMFLDADQLNEENIEKIYDEKHRYSLNEYLKEYKNNYIKSTKQMKEILIKHDILMENGNYNKDYEGKIEMINIRGNNIIKYKKSLLDKYFQDKQDSLFV